MEFLGLWLLLAALAALAFVSARLVWTKALLLVALLLSLSTWWFVDGLSGNGIDPATVYHLKTGLAGSGIEDFARSIYALVGLYVASLLPLLIPGVARRRGSHANGRLVFSAFLVCFALSIAISPLYRDAVRLAKYFSDVSPNSVSAEYKTPGALTRRKNVLWIYAEGLERTYLDESLFSDLLPNLRRLSAHALDFRDVASLSGSEWTIAGIVSSMCGMPLTAWHGNDVNSLERIGRFLPGAYCLSDHLKSEGYYLEFIGGARQEFAGKGKFLATHGFDRIKDREYFVQKGHAPQDFASWGIHDDVLLDTTLGRFLELSKAGAPFFLSALTVDTHHPSGSIPRSCADLRHATDQPMLNAVKCTDRLISRLIEQVRASPYAANTIIVLSSDHIALPNDVMGLLQSARQRRNLLYIFDADAAPRVVERPGSTFDTGATLLELLGAGRELGFGRSLLHPPSDGASKASHDGKDLAPYIAYSRATWLLESGRRIQLKGATVDFGTQNVGLPVSFAFEPDGDLNGVFLTSGDQRQISLEEPYVGRVDRCIAFTRQLNASDWCLLLTNGAGQPHIYGADRLKSGIDLGHPGTAEPVQVRLTTSYLIQQAFPRDFQFLQNGQLKGGSLYSSGTAGLLMFGPYLSLEAGHYEVRVFGSVEKPTAEAWADVTSGLGSELRARAPLIPPKGPSGVIFQHGISLEKGVSDLEIRVNAGASDSIRVDGYSVLPVAVSP
ncbi:phosphoglycerol transferase I [Lysobacter arvi]|uniref:Phosphoglycerol transferase I n=1 Tax=Lysobacter arvi TaxID=3038776 RepID=A0ABU1CBK3_9GAMM|nr:phosphoglycerol transferase I [Lysobacter arvi]MDR0181794.1 phosphoglycerol transferase I [Lysobacter arvi]